MLHHPSSRHHRHTMNPLSGQWFTLTPSFAWLMVAGIVFSGSCLIAPVECTDNLRWLPAAGNSTVPIMGAHSRIPLSQPCAADCGNGTTSVQQDGHKVNGQELAPSQVRSRQKRYVAFPEGSSFSVAFCATLGFVGNPQYIYFSWAINWGLAYELPNQTWILNQRHYRKPLPKPVVLRRQRRELYGRLETAMNNMGYDGRQCILRALCESTQLFFKRGSNMVEELLRTIFSLPKTKVLSFEHTDLHEYDAAHRRGHNRVYCGAAYPQCSFSLIEMALGEYMRSPGFM